MSGIVGTNVQAYCHANAHSDSVTDGATEPCTDTHADDSTSLVGANKGAKLRAHFPPHYWAVNESDADADGGPEP